MEMTLILNNSQADAVYTAMCALNNVGLTLSASIDGFTRVEEISGAGVIVYSLDKTPEHYQDQAAFALAYNL